MLIITEYFMCVFICVPWLFQRRYKYHSDLGLQSLRCWTVFWAVEFDSDLRSDNKCTSDRALSKSTIKIIYFFNTEEHLNGQKISWPSWIFNEYLRYVSINKKQIISTSGTSYTLLCSTFSSGTPNTIVSANTLTNCSTD